MEVGDKRRRCVQLLRPGIMLLDSDMFYCFLCDLGVFAVSSEFSGLARLSPPPARYFRDDRCNFAGSRDGF
jgi:hypothetical protein